ncbi:MOSC N-terminal beta barrel domain-containing protein [Streptomyces sp. NPDC050263]|uniref:MOSC domain-containing protein n=1 Tax=Streptomyces sp. NPDC050263 TaxID=3155037 RepID=UPI0034396D57
MTAARLTGITYYPVKGCAGIELTEATVTPTGLPDDRAYAILDEKGEVRWQWGDPALALITPRLADGELTLSAPGRDPVRGEGAKTNAWLTDVLGAPSTLVRLSPPAGNNNRLHVISRATLAALNDRLAEGGSAPLPMNRFRPNLVVDGWPTPHTEDDTPHLSIADAELTFTERTIRCAITMVDQETGRRAGPEPLRTLATYRRTGGADSDADTDKGIAFGAYFAVRRAGKVSVGDEVTRSARPRCP